ncbi:MAG: DUF4386 domain-containing protein, partial [Candidatus Eremiobacteraeota bacterium]|nr:DUF4386 domain-containing protein [Candidatus Eremiobacteraeota bacterium]
AGLGYLLNPVPYAEFVLYPRLVNPANMTETTHNIAVHGAAFVGMASCYLISFVGDIVIGWALYIMLAPVHRMLSLLASVFRYLYSAVALIGVFDLFIAYRFVNGGQFAASLSAADVHAQVALLLASFRYGWPLALMIFGVHLGLIGYLIARSTYVPKALGVLLTLDGCYWIANGLRPYAFPSTSLGPLFVVTFVELIFMVWLLVWGSRIPELHDANAGR